MKEAIQRRLDELAAEHNVPGAVIAVQDEDHVWECATGVLNLNTRVETTSDSLFQIGSITKIYTTMLVMQLLDEGIIDLDSPVVNYLPELRLSDSEATQTITVRHLLTHTSGIDGDFFEDFGRGDDCIEKYVAACSTLPLLFPAGQQFSYCNAGFDILGRLAEVQRKDGYDRLLRTRLVAPLGGPPPVTLPEEAVLFRVAAGHEPDGDGDLRVVREWMLHRAGTPSGSATCATARNLIRLANLHWPRGGGGAGILSERSVRMMQEPQIDVPTPGDRREQWGLGWQLDNWDGAGIVGHDGGTIGQLAFLRTAPDAALAVGLVTNSYTGAHLYEGLFALIFKELRGIRIPPKSAPPERGAELDLTVYPDVYERIGHRYDISLRDGALMLDLTYSGPLADLEREHGPRPLVPEDREVFYVYDPDSDDAHPVHFLGWESGRPKYLYDGRIARRAG